MEQELAPLVQQLIGAVEVAMSPMSGSRQRQEAYQLCENFKEHSPHCAACGLQLAQKNNNPVIRHFGLQLLEHCARFRWNSWQPSEKVQFKDTVLKMMAEGVDNILTEQPYIKDALSKIVVELIKREWPQHWPTMMEELSRVAALGETQTELVLLIFLRLVEDIVAFQNLPSQRRKDILQCLTAHMGELFTFFTTTLQTHTLQYHQLAHSPGEAEKIKAQCHCRVAQAVLKTLCGYVEWVSVSHVFANDGKLVESLCLLLGQQDFQLHAAECLLLLVNRRGRTEERKPLLLLFNDGAMDTILSAASSADREALQNEQHYLFLKRLCQLLVGLGQQLGTLWGPTGLGVGCPSNFSKYLSAILSFTAHSSQSLSSLTQGLWAAFLRHEHISKDSIFLEFVPKVLQQATINVVKTGLPSCSDSPSCTFSQVDFDSDDEFNSFFAAFRAQIVETVRLCTGLMPKVAFHYTNQWIRQLMASPIDPGDATAPGQGYCNLTSPSFVRWDGLTCYMETVVNKIVKLEAVQLVIPEGVSLLEDVLMYSPKDPLILSCVLTCVSTLFPFGLETIDTILPPVLQKIFAAVVFSLPDQTNATMRSRGVQNVRRHACSALLRICRDSPDILLASFDLLYGYVKKLLAEEPSLTQMEKTTLSESLMLISNQFKNFDRQSAFIQEMVSPVSAVWLSPTMKQVVSSPALFISSVGMDKPACPTGQNDPAQRDRQQVLYCINMMLGLVKRCKWPQDKEEAMRGGFVLGQSGDGAVVYRNPSTAHIIPLLENLLVLSRTLNGIWLPDIRSKIHADFTKAYDLQEGERLCVLGLHSPHPAPNDPAVGKTPVEKMQSFLTSVHDNCYHVLGNCGASLGREFYGIPQLANLCLASIMTSLDHIPDYRLRPIIRVFMKPFVQNCPSDFYSSLLLPMLSALSQYMLQRLNTRWEVINNRQAETDGAGEEVTQEVVDDQLTRLLTREYIDLLAAAFTTKRTPDTSNSQDGMQEPSENAPTFHQQEISTLGKCLLQHESVATAVLICLYSALWWNDTTSCHRAGSFAWMMLKQVLERGVQPEMINHLFLCILRGLHQHGQHESCQATLVGLGFQFYETLRPTHPQLPAVLVQVPNCTAAAVENFDNKVALNPAPAKPVPDKRKKEMFKKLVSGAIGKHVGQQFKKDVNIPNLPPLFKPPKPSKPSLDQSDTNDLGIASLFDPNKEV
ncbi:exportin-5-like [Branchiostoma floridae x Branchiostoma japonicum]